MKKILLFGATPNQGGIETFILNICKTSGPDTQIYIYKFSEEKIAYQDILEKKYGAKILNNINYRGIVGHFYRKIQYRTFFKENKFDVVHINANSPSNYDFAKAAMKLGSKVVYHSHNDRAESFVLNENFVHILNFVRKIQKRQLAKLSIKKVAVSLNAAKWMFQDYSDVQIIPNGVDFKNVVYSELKRQQGRKQLGIREESKTLLVASRLSPQKNVFKSLAVAKIAIENDIVQELIVVGEGENRQKLTRMANDFSPEIRKHIHILGAQSDMQLWYSVSDIMIMPSFYEGLPYTVLEAQANGLSILASEAIPKQAIIAPDILQFMSIEGSDEQWAQRLKSMIRMKSRVNDSIAAYKSEFSLQNFKKIMDTVYGTDKN